MEDRKGNHALLELTESLSSGWSEAGFFLRWAKWNELIYFSWVGALSLLGVRQLRRIFWNLLVWRAFLQMLISIIPVALQWFFLLNDVTQPHHRLSLNNTARDKQQRNCLMVKFSVSRCAACRNLLLQHTEQIARFFFFYERQTKKQVPLLVQNIWTTFWVFYAFLLEPRETNRTWGVDIKQRSPAQCPLKPA